MVEDHRGRGREYFGTRVQLCGYQSRSSSATLFRDSVSEQRFIEVTATSENPRQQPIVQFTVPNTLAARYNVYCVFAPACAYMEGVEADSTKVNFI